MQSTFITGNGNGGISAGPSGTGTVAEVNIEFCLLANNLFGVFAGGSGGGMGTARISNSTVTDNETGPFQSVGPFFSRGNNTVVGNVADTAGTIGSIMPK